MKKRYWILCAALCLPVAGRGISFYKLEGIDDVRIKRIAMSSTDPAFWAVASDNTLYLSNDEGHVFRKAAILVDEQVQHVFIDTNEEQTVYLAGSRHCYRISRNTERIFSARDEEEIRFIHRHGSRLYIATTKGLYSSPDPQIQWKAIPAFLGMSVQSLEGFGRNLYLAAAGGVYRYRDTAAAERLFVMRRHSDDEGLIPLTVKADSMTPTRIWLGTNQGLFVSEDRGESWRRFFINGVSRTAINCIALPPLMHDTLYLCTSSGFHRVNISSGAAEAITDGLPTSRINWVEIDDSGTLILATDRGLFRSGPGVSRFTDSPAPDTSGEPGIQEVQEAALRYNAVDPERIAQWRTRLKYRALMPRVSFDYDRTIGYSVSSSGKYFGTGPYDWGVTLSWDMGNLLWNSYEDDVDNRSRMTTLLRMDILDEINRLYFERLRLKRELAAMKHEGVDTASKEFRLYELTATLDGYTGGFFSRAIESAYP